MSGFLDLLKKFSPLDDEQEQAPAASRAPAITEATAPQAAAIQAPITEAPVAELTPQSELGTYNTPAQHYAAPQIDIEKINELVKQDNTAASQLDTKLDDLRNEYQTAKEEAARRQMYAEMIAGLGNNIGTIVAGATAMNTKANVQPVKVADIKVRDQVGDVDTRYFKDKQALLDKFKALRDTSLGAKNYADLLKTNAYLQQGYDKLNNYNDNRTKDRGITVGKEALKHQENNEVSDKQLESITGFQKTNALLNALSEKAASGKFDKYLGPYASKAENLKELNPLGDGMNTDFAQFQADVTDTLSQYIKSLSGLTVSDKERQTLLTSAPKVGDKPQTFMAKLQATQKRLAEYERLEKEAMKKHQGKNVTGYAQPQKESAPQASGTVKIMGPSGQVATVKADVAEKYLSKPGYKKVD